MDTVPATWRPLRCAAVALLSFFILGIVPASAQSFRIVHGFENPPQRPTAGLAVGPSGLLYGVTPWGGVENQGTVFRVESDGTISLVASIPTGPLRHPPTGLTRAGDLLYGIGNGEGPPPIGRGSIYSVSEGGEIELLYDFDDSEGADGAYPRAGLTLVSDGFLYGTTTEGGTNLKGVIFRIRPDGTDFGVVHHFQGEPNGSHPTTGVVEGESGVLYGVTSYGGSSRYSGVVYRLVPPSGSSTGSFTVLHRLDEWSNAGTGLTWHEATLWGTTVMGAYDRCGTLFRIETPETIPTFEQVHEFSCVEGGQNPRGDLVVGPDGALWGTTQRGSVASGPTVFRVTTGTEPQVETVHTFSLATDVPSSLTVSGDHLWGTTVGEPNRGDLGSVFRVDTLGTADTVHRFGRNTGWEVLSLTEDEGGGWYGTTFRGGPAGVGTVFGLGADGALTGVHDFSDTPFGIAPRTYVTRASDGNLYGARSLGPEVDGSGFLFRMEPDGVRTDQHVFEGLPYDGAYPAAPLLEATDGTLYGTTGSGGGSRTLGTVFRATTDGQFDILESFNGPEGATPNRPLIEGSDGWIYGTATFGGQFGYGVVFRFVPDGAFQPVHHFPGQQLSSDPTSRPDGSVTEVEPGRFLGAAWGGLANQGVLYEITVDAEPGAPATYRTIFTFGPDPSLGLSPKGALATGPDGLVYGTASRGGPDGAGLVFRLDPDDDSLEAVHSFSGIDGAQPDGLQAGSDGDLYGFTPAGGPGGGGVVYRLCFAPEVAVGGPYSVPEGGSHLVSAAQGSDKRVSFEWDLDGDGGFDAEGEEVVFSASGLAGPSTQVVLVRVTDDCGLWSEATTTVELTNVAPVVDAGPDVSLSLGDRLATPGSFVDPGADTWSATVDYGDGTGVQALPLAGRSFTLDHVYSATGTFVVTVTVDDGTDSGSDALVVTVASVESTIEELIARVEGLVEDGKINSGRGRSLIAQLELALWFLEQPGGEVLAAQHLEQFIKKVEAFIEVGGIAPEDGNPLIATATLILEQLQGG